MRTTKPSKQPKKKVQVKKTVNKKAVAKTSAPKKTAVKKVSASKRSRGALLPIPQKELQRLTARLKARGQTFGPWALSVIRRAAEELPEVGAEATIN